jgi:hypothetical protein
LKGLAFKSNSVLTSPIVHQRPHAHLRIDIVNNNIAQTDLGQTNNTNYTCQTTLNYGFELKDVHKFNVLLGSEINKQNYIDFACLV